MSSIRQFKTNYSLMKYTEILQCNRKLGASLVGEEYSIALLSNITVNQLKDILELTLREYKIKAEVIVGDYDNIIQDSSRFQDVKAIVIFWEAANFVDFFHCRVDLFTDDELMALSQRIEGEMDLIINNFRNTPLVIINRFSSLLFNSNELRDDSLKQFCKRLNMSLEKKATSNLLIVDMDAVLVQIGLDSSVDFRQFQSTKALYSIGFFSAYAKALAPAFRSATGRSKKLLILDCDNTLWGGILGEDGELGLKMGDDTVKGKCFREIQYILQGFRLQGVLLALCSKNNPDDIDKLFATHPDMILKDEDFVAKKVNWLDKLSNLRQLAIELNLGLDSFVFVDDSSFEIGLIQKELPQVKCVQVPQNLSEYPSVMRALRREFFALSNTEEDKSKTEMYRQEKLRKDQAAQFSSIEDYLTSLELTITVVWNEEIPLARAAQLTQKTNQFNLTTHRYTEADILRMLADPCYTIAVFSVTDKYGDYGVVGISIIRIQQDQANRAKIDTLLMSCRVIGRNIEFAFFNLVVQRLHELNITDIDAEYLSTPKNSQVDSFYDRLGFSQIHGNELHKTYHCNIINWKPININYIKIKSK